MLPQLVTEFEDGYKGVNYVELVPILIGVLKEQQLRLDALETRLESGNTRLATP